MEPQLVMLPVESVKIGNRQRTVDAATKKHIDELSQDIAADGLIHAIAVSKDHDLIAGFCRLNAITALKSPYKYGSADIGPGFIPCMVLHHEDQKDQYRVELMENLRRKNLSPVDEAVAVARLHELYKSEHGPGWTEEATGFKLNELRGESRGRDASQGEVADSLILARFAEDEDVKAAPTRAKATNIARKKLEQSLTAALGAVLVLDQQDMVLHEGSCFDVMAKMESGSIDGIIADPPYGVDADAFGDQKMVTGHNYADDPKQAAAIGRWVLSRGFDLCKANAHMYFFCDIRHFFPFQLVAEQAGWKTFQTPLLWYKTNIGHAPIPGFFSRRYEAILFCYKGSKALSSTHPDIFEHAVPANRLHAAEKPINLYEDFLNLSFIPGETVLDPCAGGGTIFRAARLARVKAIGIEVDPQSANFCRAAIAEA